MLVMLIKCTFIANFRYSWYFMPLQIINKCITSVQGRFWLAYDQIFLFCINQIQSFWKVTTFVLLFFNHRWYICDTGARRTLFKSVRSWCIGSSDQSLMVDPMSCFSAWPVLHDWYSKGHCMVHTKQHLLLIGKSSLSGGSRFTLTVWVVFNICPTPNNSKINVLSASLIKHSLPSLFVIHFKWYKISKCENWKI